MFAESIRVFDQSWIAEDKTNGKPVWTAGDASCSPPTERMVNGGNIESWRMVRMVEWPGVEDCE